MHAESVHHRSRVPRALSVTRYIGQVALASIAVAAAALLVVPKLLGWEGVLVLTGSMEPALDAGGVAFVDRVPVDRIGSGDIMTFMPVNSRNQATHRVVAVTPTADGPQFRTKGDANHIADSWIVTPKQVIGKVRWALPNLGSFGRLLVSDRHVLALFMALPAAFLVGDEARRWRRERRAVRQWLDEDRNRVPVVDPPLPPVEERPRRTRKTLVSA